MALNPRPKKASNLGAKFSDRLSRLATLNREIGHDLYILTGKKAKGDQLVGLLGEALVAELLDGKVLPDEGSEIDVLVGKTRISVKTRRGSGRGWKQTSPISTNEPNAVDHLAFVHLDGNYRLDKVWIFPWADLVKSGRIKPKKVRKIPRGFLFHLSPKRDSPFQAYP